MPSVTRDSTRSCRDWIGWDNGVSMRFPDSDDVRGSYRTTRSNLEMIFVGGIGDEARTATRSSPITR
ncbi:hypothetical protein GCM10023214_30160 [Amycolatopsis dongchuanensis]|uniref:Uncharacterized protein n=1 Tax=Amycolatopsis dongchuanensis TaxID=1070866 RepID=A0ABP9QJ56_9PSEU